MKRVLSKQYRDNVSRAQSQLTGLVMPAEGWIRSVRRALGMSGAQLARRMGVSRALVSNTERAEQQGGVTLKAMQKMAQAMRCRFVYAIVPDQGLDNILYERALEKARAEVKAASVHDVLDGQHMNESKLEEQITCLAQEWVENISSDLWNDR